MAPLCMLLLQHAIMNDKVPVCSFCAATVKPDVVFFGEDLPQKYFLHTKDFPKADLLIIMGTSLQVHVLNITICITWRKGMYNVVSKKTPNPSTKTWVCFRSSRVPAWWTRCVPPFLVSSWTGTLWGRLRRSHCAEETTWSSETWRSRYGGSLTCSAGAMRSKNWWGLRKHWWGFIWSTAPGRSFLFFLIVVCPISPWQKICFLWNTSTLWCVELDSLVQNSDYLPFAANLSLSWN